MKKCLTSEELSALTSGSLPQEEQSAAMLHIETCNHCQDTFDTFIASDNEFQRLINLQQQSRQVSPLPAGLIDRVMDRLAAPPSVAPSREAFPVIPEYKLIEFIGGGGMGAVYRGRHQRMHRDDAIKVLRPETANREEHVARFDREMAALGKIQHPNLVQAYSAGEHDGVRFMVMELLDGADLSVILAALQTLQTADACEITRQAALGIQAAHDSGLVHRDIKPSNLMLARTNEGCIVKVLDMGLAQFAEHHLPSEGLTAAGQVMGTLEYMAPEQASDSRSVDGCADIYSLGFTLYKMLCGEAPFPARKYTTPLQLLSAIATLAPEPLENRVKVPRGLAALIVRMINRDPAARPRASEVAAELARYCGGANIPALLDAAAVTPPCVPGAETVAMSDTSVSTESASTGRRMATGWWVATVAGFVLLAAMAIAAPLTLFVQAEDGVLKIQVNDPAIEVRVKDSTAFIKGKGSKSFELTPGQHGILVRRGNLTYETVKFQMVRGDKKLLTVDWIQGKLQVKDGAKTHQPATTGGKPEEHRPAQPHVFLTGDKAKEPTWKRGTVTTPLPRGLIPAPADFPGIKGWQVYFTDNEITNSSTSVRYQESPDGRYIGRIIDLNRPHARLHWPQPELRVHDATTGKLVYLSPVKINGFSPVWSDDSKSLAIHGEKFRRNLDGTRGAPIDTPVRGEAWKDMPDSLVEKLNIPASPRIFNPVTAWDPSGRYFAMLQKTGVHIYAVDGVRRKILKAPADAAYGMHIGWSASGKHLILSETGSLIIWNVKSAEVVHCIQGKKTSGAKFHPTREGVLAIASNPLQICNWMEDGVLEASLQNDAGRNDAEWVMKWSPDGNYIAANGPEKIEIWNADGERLVSHETNTPREAFFWLPDSQSIRVADTRNYNELTLDGKMLEVAPPRPGPAFSYYLDVHPAGDVFSMRAKLYDVATASPGPGIERAWDHVYPYAGYASAAFSPDGKFLAITCRLGTVIRNTKDYKISRMILPLANEQYITFSPAGEVLAASKQASDGMVYLVEDEAGRLQLYDHAGFQQRIGQAE